MLWTLALAVASAGCAKDSAGPAPVFPTETEDIGAVFPTQDATVTSNDASGPPTSADGVSTGPDAGAALPTNCTVANADGTPGWDYRENGTPCDDGNLCTVEDACHNGICVGGANQICDAEGACRLGSCNPAQGCVYEDAADESPCAVACFGAATCQGGSCEVDPSTAVQCPEPENACIDQLGCDSATGECTVEIYVPEDTPCNDDDNICSHEVCDGAGQCVTTGEVETCTAENQGNPCWTYTCTKKTGCVPTNFVQGLSCDDNNPCTVNDICTTNGVGQKTCLGGVVDVDDNNPCTNDTCVDGEVLHSPINGVPCDPLSPCSDSGMCADGTCMPDEACECDLDADCAPPENLCAGVMICDKSGAEPTCALKPNSQVICGQATKTCHYSTCDPGTGLCVELPVADGLACDDEDLCSLDDTCAGGSCIGAQSLKCNDGFYCNGEETCDPSVGCVSSPAPDPDDGVSCTLDTCDEATDSFLHTPDHGECDDGLFCNGEEICTNKGCAPGIFLDFEDGNPCTEGVCDEEIDLIVQQPQDSPCSDGDACTLSDTCVDGVCIGNTLTDEGPLCNGVDDDCDGLTDENCSFTLRGHMMGGGYTLGTNEAGYTLKQSTGTPRFVGTSSNGAFTLRAGLPQGEQ
ncbi:MAG: hypothetical protein VYE15_02195 [Myxococcota bacterium]|nr:hypothetical protein [Myxococcota bacterium]